MAVTAYDGGSTRTYVPQPEPRPTPTPTTTPTPTSSYRPEPTYNPLAPTTTTSASQGPSGVGGTQYGIPAGNTLSGVASGTQAQPFDVTLSQLATAVYGTRGAPPEGWSAVTDQQLIDRGIADPQAWREQYLGADEHLPPDQQNPQEFRAEVYTDGQGNFVLSYRGTAEGGADWDNNFSQGLGFETPDGDKFAGTAATTAIEFEQRFGNNSGGESTNLAITGHSQGGGLASVGSLATGVPAVTFDASGIHPNTLDRMNIDPQAARNMAEGGQIRAYSLSGDALTRLQDSWATGLVAPDALGTQIVVNPSSADANNMFTNHGGREGISNPGLVNVAVEGARHTPFLPINPVTGLVTGGVNLVGELAYAGISHSPNALTNGMIEHQPWQVGYENPSSWSRDLQNLLPDPVKDDYARNTHDFVTDVQNVVATDFANGNYVQGAASIYGDFVEGAWNSAGDTVDGYADQLAASANGWVGGGVPGAILSTTIDGAGDVVEFGTDVIGQTAETLSDGAGWVGQKATDFVGWALGR
jgi:hypothetical protein